MSIKLIFSFDSEDYETPAADDAEKWWAETMTKHGITACTCVVGELARMLWKRLNYGFKPHAYGRRSQRR